MKPGGKRVCAEKINVEILNRKKSELVLFPNFHVSISLPLKSDEIETKY